MFGILKANFKFLILPKRPASLISVLSSSPVGDFPSHNDACLEICSLSTLAGISSEGGCQLSSKAEIFQVKVTCFGIIPFAKVPCETFVSKVH